MRDSPRSGSPNQQTGGKTEPRIYDSTFFKRAIQRAAFSFAPCRARVRGTTTAAASPNPPSLRPRRRRGEPADPSLRHPGPRAHARHEGNEETLTWTSSRSITPRRNPACEAKFAHGLDRSVDRYDEDDDDDALVNGGGASFASWRDVPRRLVEVEGNVEDVRRRLLALELHGRRRAREDSANVAVGLPGPRMRACLQTASLTCLRLNRTIDWNLDPPPSPPASAPLFANRRREPIRKPTRNLHLLANGPAHGGVVLFLRSRGQPAGDHRAVRQQDRAARRVRRSRAVARRQLCALRRVSRGEVHTSQGRSRVRVDVVRL